jgi:hypothetical protein
MSGVIPIIKERRIEYIIKSLRCFDENPFNREMQKNCILRIYKGSNEQTAFRGIAVQTLRKLGLIVGYGETIRLTSNAKIIIDSEKFSMTKQVTRSVVMEIDSKKFSFIELIRTDKAKTFSRLLSYLQKKNESISVKSLHERAKSWLDILSDVDLIDSRKSGIIKLNEINFNKATQDLSVNEKIPFFDKMLLESYSSLHEYGTSGMVDIVDLRNSLATNYLREYRLILTKEQIDMLLEQTPKITNHYIITLGQPMGAEEQLLSYRGKYYRTINIKLLRDES